MSTPSPRLVRPMLAKVYEPRHWYVGGMFVQPKLNGIRAMYSNGTFMSRDGLAWSPSCLLHIRAALASLPSNIILDGELYCHGLSLQQINSRIAVTRTSPHEKETTISYNVFDQVSEEGFGVRHASLRLAFQEHLDPSVLTTAVRFVSTFYAVLPRETDILFHHHKSNGYEGLMYRHPLMPYSVPDICGNKENRSSWLLKRKEWLDLDAEIIDVLPGNGRLESTCGSLSLVVHHNGTPSYFSAGSGLTDLSRDELWRRRDEITTAYEELSPWIVKIRYEMLSDSGVPLKPTIILIPNLK